MVGDIRQLRLSAAMDRCHNEKHNTPYSYLILLPTKLNPRVNHYRNGIERRDRSIELKRNIGKEPRRPTKHSTMRPTLFLRAGHYTPKIQFMGSKWKEAKSEFRLSYPTKNNRGPLSSSGRSLYLYASIETYDIHRLHPSKLTPRTSRTRTPPNGPSRNRKRFPIIPSKTPIILNIPLQPIFNTKRSNSPRFRER